MSQMARVHILTPYFFKIHFNSFICGLLNDAILSQTTRRRFIILPTTSRSSKTSCLELGQGCEEQLIMCSLVRTTASLRGGSTGEYGETVERLAGENRRGSESNLVQFQTNEAGSITLKWKSVSPKIMLATITEND
jgi:hypothetical protein